MFENWLIPCEDALSSFPEIEENIFPPLTIKWPPSVTDRFQAFAVVLKKHGTSLVNNSAFVKTGRFTRIFESDGT